MKLHLNLKKQWFDLILDGEKEEEYREIKPYWVKRLIWDHFCIFEDPEQMDNFIHASKTKTKEQLMNFFSCETAFFSSIIFSNGYSKDRPQFEIEFKGFEIRTGIPEWGAEENQKYFVLKLGEVLTKNNC